MLEENWWHILPGEELKHSPSVAIIEYGQGVWIHGPETVARIANYAPAFAQKAAQQEG